MTTTPIASIPADFQGELIETSDFSKASWVGKTVRLSSLIRGKKTFLSTGYNGVTDKLYANCDNGEFYVLSY